MTPDTLLLRQIHPAFVQAGRVTSQAFRPTPKDQSLLSVDNGSRISAAAAWQRFTAAPHCQSAGVQSVSCGECAQQNLPVHEDGTPYPEHCSIDFSGCNNSAAVKKSQKLRVLAEQRGWLFKADGEL